MEHRGLGEGTERRGGRGKTGGEKEEGQDMRRIATADGVLVLVVLVLSIVGLVGLSK